MSWPQQSQHSTQAHWIRTTAQSRQQYSATHKHTSQSTRQKTKQYFAFYLTIVDVHQVIPSHPLTQSLCWRVPDVKNVTTTPPTEPLLMQGEEKPHQRLTLSLSAIIPVGTLTPMAS